MSGVRVPSAPPFSIYFDGPLTVTQVFVHGKKLSSAAERVMLLLINVFAIITLCFAMPGSAVSDSESNFQPQVLVLIMGGQGSHDLVSINYTDVVPLSTAQADLDSIAKIGNWEAVDARGETRSSGGPNPVDTTSISFKAKGIIGYDNGSHPIEPFITPLKRFKNIEIDYIVPSGIEFRGLQDYENKYVKIQLKSMGSNAHRYRVVVKDAGFAALDLPLLQPAEPVEDEQGGRTLAQRLMLGIALGLVGAAGAYILTAVIIRRRAA